LPVTFVKSSPAAAGDVTGCVEHGANRRPAAGFRLDDCLDRHRVGTGRPAQPATATTISRINAEIQTPRLLLPAHSVIT
jgi:hypothetical protein